MRDRSGWTIGRCPGDRGCIGTEVAATIMTEVILAGKDVWFAQQQPNQRAGRRAAKMRELVQIGILELPTSKREMRAEIECLSYGVPVKRFARNASGSLWADAAARRAASSPEVR
jgi:hypothetical protein